MTEIGEPRIIPTEDFPFQVFLKQIADQITDEEVKSLKFLWSGKGGIGKLMWEQIKDAIDLFRHLKESRLLSPNNFATLQAMIWHLGRKDLYQKFVDFCETRPTTLNFYVPSETPANGFKYVNFHLRGTGAYDRNRIQNLRSEMSDLLCCPIEYIIHEGVVPTGSIYVTFMIPEWCIDVLMKIQQEYKARLNSFGVDRFKVGDDYVDCKDFQEGDERPDMDKDTAVNKIIQENKQLLTDLEHFRESYYKSERALKKMESQYDAAMQKADLLRSKVEELKEYAANLFGTNYFPRQGLLHSSTDNNSCQEDILHRKNERPISQENLDDLEQMSGLTQAKLIEILPTNSKACEIITEIMSKVQLYRQDPAELKRHIHTIVGTQDFEEVYKKVEYLTRITIAIKVQQTLEAENTNL